MRPPANPSAVSRIVLVEDQTLLRQMLGMVIEGVPDYELVAACSGVTDGFQACITLRPDLVVLDWKLADGTGETLMQTSALAGLPIRWLVISGYQDTNIIRRALGCGAHGFVLKDSSLDVFREALASILAGHTYFCPRTSTLLAEALRQTSPPNPDGLSEREIFILRHFASGLNPKQIAEQLHVQVKTVRNQLGQIRQKLGITETAGLVRYAIGQGLV